RTAGCAAGQPGPLPEACSCRNSLLFEVAGKTRSGGRDAGPGTEIDLRRDGAALVARRQLLDLGAELLRRGNQLTVQSRLLFSEVGRIGFHLVLRQANAFGRSLQGVRSRVLAESLDGLTMLGNQGGQSIRNCLLDGAIPLGGAGWDREAEQLA